MSFVTMRTSLRLNLYLVPCLVPKVDTVVSLSLFFYSLDNKLSNVMALSRAITVESLLLKESLVLHFNKLLFKFSKDIFFVA